MKIILLGNAGAGKSTLSRKLLTKFPAARLSLDEVAFGTGAERRPLQDSIEDVKRWIADHDSWIIEGCYADIIQPLLSACDELIFLNPGVDACLSHCRSRPWEPEKFGSRQEQDKNLENLLEWVSTYECRKDEYGLFRHRQLFDSFPGAKREYRDASDYAFGKGDRFIFRSCPVLNIPTLMKCLASLLHRKTSHVALTFTAPTVRAQPFGTTS